MNHSTRKHRQQQTHQHLRKQLRLEVTTEVHVLEIVDGSESKHEDLRTQETS